MGTTRSVSTGTSEGVSMTAGLMDVGLSGVNGGETIISRLALGTAPELEITAFGSELLVASKSANASSGFCIALLRAAILAKDLRICSACSGEVFRLGNARELAILLIHFVTISLSSALSDFCGEISTGFLALLGPGFLLLLSSVSHDTAAELNRDCFEEKLVVGIAGFVGVSEVNVEQTGVVGTEKNKAGVESVVIAARRAGTAEVTAPAEHAGRENRETPVATSPIIKEKMSQQTI